MDVRSDGRARRTHSAVDPKNSHAGFRFDYRQSSLLLLGKRLLLSGDECGASGGAGRLGIMISEHDALSSYTIDVGRPVAHGAVTIGADVLPTDVIWENNEDVGFLVLGLNGNQY